MILFQSPKAVSRTRHPRDYGLGHKPSPGLVGATQSFGFLRRLASIAIEIDQACFSISGHT